MESTGIHILIRRCETDIPAEALKLLDELTEAGASGLAVCAANDPSITARISALADEGIPCVTFNSDLPDSRRLCFVGQDIYKAGRVAGGLMSRCIPAGSQLLATVGNLKFDGHRQRLAGFRDRIREAGFPMEDLVVAETFNDYETTFRVVTEAPSRCITIASAASRPLTGIPGCGVSTWRISAFPDAPPPLNRLGKRGPSGSSATI